MVMVKITNLIKYTILVKYIFSRWKVHCVKRSSSHITTVDQVCNSMKSHLGCL